MSEMKYLKFWSKGKKGRALSNFAELSVVIDGREYKTGEHAFHGNKYFTSAQLYDDKKKRKQKLLDYANKFVGDDTEFQTALDAKKGGSKTKFRLKDNEIEAWKDNSIETQKIINKYKYETYPEVRQVLEKYSDHILLHQDNRAKEDTIWGARIVDGVMIGQNLLGKMWEETRKEMTGGPATPPPDVPPQPVEPEAPVYNPTTPPYYVPTTDPWPPTSPDYVPTSPGYGPTSRYEYNPTEPEPQPEFKVESPPYEPGPLPPGHGDKLETPEDLNAQLVKIEEEIDKLSKDTEMEEEKREQLNKVYQSQKLNLQQLIVNKEMLKTLKEDAKPFINYTPPGYYRPQMEGETDEQYEERLNSYKDYEELNRYFRDIPGYDGDMEYIQKAIEKYREHIVNL